MTGHYEQAARGHLWLEVTNGCNLSCQHCYSDSYPGSHVRDRLTTDQYVQVLEQGYGLGFRSVQFIGGEPTLNKDLHRLIRSAFDIGFTSIEMFSNLRSISRVVVQSLQDFGCKVATSIYSHDECVHDDITKVRGSHRSTLENIHRLTANGVGVRVGFVELESNRGHFQPVVEMLRALGVRDVANDRVRAVGRASDQPAALSELCGACSGATACVSYDGSVLPCIMARGKLLGSIASSTLADILLSGVTATVRSEIALATRGGESFCHPNTCNPHMPDCGPYSPCLPSTCHPYQPGGPPIRPDMTYVANK